jgi:hypothetical protein
VRRAATRSGPHPAAAPALEKDLGIDHAFIGVLLGFGKGGYAAGKVGAGMMVDWCATKHITQAAATAMSTCML